MSSNLMDTEPGGESGQYEGDLGLTKPHKKSGGQLGEVETTEDPSETAEGQQEAADRGAQTAENVRYGQTISETGGAGGMTSNTDGVVDQAEGTDNADEDGKAARQAQGYGGKEGYDKDADQTIGA